MHDGILAQSVGVVTVLVPRYTCPHPPRHVRGPGCMVQGTGLGAEGGCMLARSYAACMRAWQDALNS
jgi:hypothetical protein